VREHQDVTDPAHQEEYLFLVDPMVFMGEQVTIKHKTGHLVCKPGFDYFFLFKDSKNLPLGGRDSKPVGQYDLVPEINSPV